MPKASAAAAASAAAPIRLAYLQSKIGYAVKMDMPGHEGPELDTLYAKGANWLKGKKL